MQGPMSTPDDILPTYEAHGPAFAATRDRSLFERRWLDRLIGHAPRHDGPARVLDLGCGAGRPIAAYLADRGLRVTGVDGAASMLALFETALPGCEAILADMRNLALGRSFDAIVAWNSFFHLAPADQRAMFPVFAAHAAPGAALLITTGPDASERIGTAGGAEVYHASLDPAEYRALFKASGFEVLRFVPEDPDCRGHTIWLARQRRSR